MFLLGQAPPPGNSIALIKDQAQAIEREDRGRFSGRAWDALIADAASAQFIMVGEQHGSADIARFETALFNELSRRGVTHSALEVGPISTAFAERLVRSGAGALHRYIAMPGHGFTLPFLFFKEEADLAEAMVESSPDRSNALFGLDQEFVGAAPILLAELQKAASNAGQRRALAELSLAATKDPMLVGKVEDDQLTALEQAFEGNARALEIIGAIRISAEIYKPFISGKGSGYAANLAREEYMKMNFVRQFEAAKQRNGAPPKVFFKFGANHAMRGMSGTNVPALGNFLAEWGLPRRYRMINLMVDCIGGEALNPQTGKPAPCESYFGADSLIRQALADGPAVQIVDLRPLRPMLRRLSGADEASRKIILAFDYYVAVRAGAAATPLGELPRS